MLQRVFLIFTGPIDRSEVGAGFVIEYKDQPIAFYPYNVAVLYTDTIWNTDIVRHLAASYLHQRGIYGAVVAD